jgi:hypothetical protein
MLPAKSSCRVTLLGGIIVGSMLVAACSSRAVSAPTPTPFPSPTMGPRATPTVTSLVTISPDSPTLGGSWQAFDNLFGNSDCCYQNGWNYQGQFGPSWTGTIEAGDSASVLPSNPNSRVTGIQLDPQASQQNWSMSQAQMMLDQFMPPDAKREQTKTISVGNVAVGTEETYSSVLLARTLPKADFTYINGNQAPPGVFFVYVNNGSETGVDVSTLGADESYVLTST